MKHDRQISRATAKLVAAFTLFAALLPLGVTHAPGASSPPAPPTRSFNARDYTACDGSTDDTAGLQRAIGELAGGGELVIPGGATCRISAELLIHQKHAVKVRGAGTASLRWTGTAQPTKAMIRITASSDVALESLRLDALQAQKPGYGIWITSAGTSVTQFNKIRQLRIDGPSDTGIKIGNANNLDTNLDGTSIEDTQIDQIGRNAIAIDGANTNQTSIVRGAFGAGATSSIYIGTYARGVHIDGPMFVDTNKASIPGLIHISNKFSGIVTIRNIVVELHRHPFLYAAPSERSAIASGMVTIDGFVSTCNFLENRSPASRIIDFNQHGLLSLKNARIAGRTDNSPTYVAYTTPDIPGHGLRTFELENVLFYPARMQPLYTSVSNTQSPTTVRGWYRTAASDSAPAGEITYLPAARAP